MKNNYKKSIFAVIGIAVTVIIVIVIASVSAKATKGGLKDWFFYDSYVESNVPFLRSLVGSAADNIDTSRCIKDAKEPSDELMDLFEKVRTNIRETFKDLNGLNWERFESAQFKTCFAYELNDAGFDAEYDVNTNTFYAFGYFLTEVEDQEHIMTHELIHALTAIPDASVSILYEGLTEYMAQLASPCKRVAYERSVEFATIYAKVYGLGQTIEVFSADKPQAVLSGLIGDRDGVFQNLEPMLIYDAYTLDPDVVFAIYDAMCHFSQAIGGDSDVVWEMLDNVGVSRSQYSDYYADVLGR